jgi:putative restriction endonuclease
MGAQSGSMQGLIAITDHDWFEFLSWQKNLDEVNFWRPSDTRTPRQLKIGTPVLFKLRKRYGGWIVGWGIFARHDVLPAWLAWDAFEAKNGAETFGEMRRRIERLRHDAGAVRTGAGDYKIGCLMLAEPVFLPRARWIAPPADWPENSVQGKAYDLDRGEGQRVWRECLVAGAPTCQEAVRDPAAGVPGRRYGEAVLVRPRLGQGIFRIAVMGAYGSACAVTAEHSIPALEAAHIRPFGDGGPHEVPNGLLLRSDIHRLYDKGYVGVTPEHRFVVSRRLKDDFENGRTYYPFDGTPIRLPRESADWPSAAQLKWHLAEIFRE